MRQLIPFVDDGIDPTRTVLDEAREAPDRPWWLYSNMVASVDGATAVSGRSGALGGEADRQVFRALRATADVILVGASTVRAEQYRLPRTATGIAAAHRTNRGLDALPVLCIVSGSLEVAPTTPVFEELRAGATAGRVLIVTTTSAPAAPPHVAELAEVLRVGTDRVDLRELVATLASRGHTRILCEGGPSLLGQLAEEDLIDEWNLTISPLIVGGDARRVTHGAELAQAPVLLDRLMVDDDSTMFTRYLRVAGER